MENRLNKSKEAYRKQLALIQRHKDRITKKEQQYIKLGGDGDNKLADFRTNPDLYWALSDLDNSKDDLVQAEKKLETIKQAIAKWEKAIADYEAKLNKIDNEVPAVIKDFLDDWADKVIKWYIDRLSEYRKKINNINDQYNKLEIDSTEHRTKYKEIKLEYIDPIMQQLLNSTNPTLKIREIIEKDKENKILSLIKRVENITGKITDAKHLKVNEKGELDGVVIGDKGKARIETISAGGYNIQVFHYRLLVKEIK